MAAASAGALAAEPFSIRGFAARMRAEDAAKCWQIDGLETETSLLLPLPLPPMDPPPRSRWWAHELAAVRARPDVWAAGGEAAVGGGNAGGLGRATKRKGSRGSGVDERAKKRQRALQLSFSLKHKERTSKPQSASCLLQHHMGLLRKRKLQERQDHMSIHRNSLKKQCVTGMDHKRSIKASRQTNHPLNPVCEVVEHVTYPPKDDIFGDLPLLESSKIMFCTGVDILPTVIEDSFLENQNGEDAMSETEQFKLMPSSDISKQMSSPLEDLVKNDQTPDKESTCISLDDAGRSHSFSKFDGPLNHTSATMEKTCVAEMQLKSTDVPALSSYCKEGAKSGSSNLLQGCFYTNTDCFLEIKRTGISSATVRTRPEETNKDRDAAVRDKKSTDICGRMVPSDFYTNTDCFQEIKRTDISSATVRTRIEALNKDRDAAVRGKKSTDICGRLIPSEYHLSRQAASILSVVSQGTASAGISTDAMSSSRSMPAKEYAPTSSPFKFASNIYHESRKSVDTRTPLSMDNQGSCYSKVYPGHSPASIDLSFMKLPGLERMEISSYDPRTGENNFMNGRLMNTIRSQEQQLVSGMTSIIQGQNNIGFSDSQAGKKAPDGFVARDNCHSHQPTMRLMGRTVSVCKSSKEQELTTTAKGWIDSSIVEGDRPSAISCQLPPKRPFPFNDSVVPRARILESSDMLPRIPNSTLAQARPIVSDAQNHSLQQTNNVCSKFKDCTWNSGSHFGGRTQVNKESAIGVNSRTRHSELDQPPTLTSIPRNQCLNLRTPGSSLHTADHTFVRSAVNQPSTSFPQWPLNMSMQGQYRKSTSLAYQDLRSVPTHQPYQVPGANLFPTPIISFDDRDTNSTKSRNSYQRAHPSLTASLASKSISPISPMCTGSLLNIDGRRGVSFVDQTIKRPTCADNVSQQPAKRQLVADKLEELTSPMFPNMKNYSSGWSLNDAVGPQILDFSNKLARNATQISKKKNNHLGNNSIPVVEARSGIVSMVEGAKTTSKPGQNLLDSTKF